MHGEYRKINSSGPGGRGCACCFPQSGKGRRAARKQDERKVRRMFSSLIQKGILNAESNYQAAKSE